MSEEAGDGADGELSLQALNEGEPVSLEDQAADQAAVSKIASIIQQTFFQQWGAVTTFVRLLYQVEKYLLLTFFHSHLPIVRLVSTCYALISSEWNKCAPNCPTPEFIPLWEFYLITKGPDCAYGHVVCLFTIISRRCYIIFVQV